jgi:hypothetical protein
VAKNGRAYLRLVVLGAAIGIPAALVAALFLAGLDATPAAVLAGVAAWLAMEALEPRGQAAADVSQ